MKQKIQKGIRQLGRMVFIDSLSLFKKCGLSLILFELIYKLAATAILYPCFIYGLNFTIQRAGFRYLTNNYFFTYLKSPFTIIFFLLIFLILAAYITIELACLSMCFDAGYHGIKLSITEIFRSGIKLLKKTMKKKKINTLFHIISIALMMNATIMGIVLSNITIPDMASDYIYEHRIIIISLIILFVLFFIYCLFHIFSMNFMEYDGGDITESKQKSRILTKRRKFKTFITMAGWNVLILLLVYLFYFVLSFLIVAGVYLLDMVNMGMAIYLSIFRVVITIVQILLVVVGIPLSYGVISSLFYRYRCDSGNVLNIGEAVEAIERNKKLHTKMQFKISGIIAAVLLVLNVVYMVMAFDDNPFDVTDAFLDTQVMAHRGCSYNAPENTMLAFENAVDAMADYIELDVHETADGQIVVMHDSSLRRTTGVNEYIYDVTYDEIKDLDAGSYFGEDEIFAECRIPLLSEVMEYTKGKIMLNIEIKLTNEEPELVEKVAELIAQYEFQEDCYVTSMSYDALKQIKQIDETIQTGYVLTVAYGSFYNLDYCDAFSINSAYINKNMVDAIHNRGKVIMAWTVNGEARAKELTAMGVDAIITDNPVMAREVVYSKYNNTLISNVLNYVFD